MLRYIKIQTTLTRRHAYQAILEREELERQGHDAGLCGRSDWKCSICTRLEEENSDEV